MHIRGIYIYAINCLNYSLITLFAVLIIGFIPPLHARKSKDFRREEPTSSKTLDKQRLAASTTLEETLIDAITAFRIGKYADASGYFEILDHVFGKEPQYSTQSMQTLVLPIWGYCYYRNQDYESAIGIFQRFIQRYPPKTRGCDFVIYTLAQAYKASGRIQEAIDTFEIFKQSYPHRPEIGLVWLEQAKLLFHINEDKQALELLERFYYSSSEPSLRIQGRILALQQAHERGYSKEAEAILFHTPWNVNKMPELAVIAFTALSIGDRFHSEKAYAKALKAYRLVPPQDQLIRLQEKHLYKIKQEAKLKLDRLSASPHAPFWEKHYRTLIAKIKSQLGSLKQSEDYTPSFLLRYGQTFLLLERFHEGWIVFETITLQASYPENIREEAQFRWILSAQALENWEDALAIARDFMEMYPDSPLVTRALYLIAESYQGLQEYAQAIDVLNDLIEHYPEDPLVGRWYFVRGFNAVMLGENKRAREDFITYQDLYPEGILYIQARLWEALTFFFDKEYDPAIQHFNELVAVAKNHPLLPEILYKRAMTYYAMRAYETALPEIQAYLTQYSHHTRAPEAQVLQGDILMGLGRLEEAATVFEQVTPESEGLFPYAVFQAGKIYKARAGLWEKDHPEDAQGQYDKMIEHFQHYIRRDDVINKPRISEAIYWVGWAYAQKNQMDRSIAIYRDALKRWGNDKEENGIVSILQGLQQLYKHFRHPSGLEKPQMKEDFITWVEQEIKQSLKSEQYTYYSRLQLFLHRHYQKQKNNPAAESALLDAWQHTPMEDLDAEGLGKIGMMILDLLSSPQSAQEYFEHLIAHFPNNSARAYAFYGLGHIFYQYYTQTPDTEKADALLKKSQTFLGRFQQETPAHPLITRVSLLLGRVYTSMGKYDEGQSTYESLLRLRQARGRPHAQALLGLSDLFKAKNDFKKAIAYSQRVYTTYRAYPELIIQAYMSSAQHFEKIGDISAAYNTYEEMLKDERLKNYDEYPNAQQAYQRLKNLLPLPAPSI